MLVSLAIIFLLGLICSKFVEKIKLPGLIAMILVGIIISPYMDNKILNISSELRTIALIVILTRSGLSLDFNELKKVGKSSILLSFLPATFEIIACIFIAPLIFNISYLEAALLGSVLAAVSPAVVAPRMIKLIENKASKKGIPEMILFGASIDDVYVIVFFTSFLSLLTTNIFSYKEIFMVPFKIVFGILFGIILGKITIFLFKKIYMSKITKTIILISISFLILPIQNYLPISTLLSIMTMGMCINYEIKDICIELKETYANLWTVFEIFLFVLVGISVKISYLKENVILGIILLLLILIFRMLAVYISVGNNGLNYREKIFCMFSYIPKATVQAAIGGIPLAMGVKSGNLILTISVIAILFTAPLGAFLMDNTRYLLKDVV